MSKKTSPQSHPWSEGLHTGTRTISLLGYGMIALFLGGFGVWSVTVPLASAVIAPGVVQAAGSNVEIQHLEGGLIDVMHVAEGDAVLAGTPLLTLDGTAARARLNSHINQWVGLLARRARLMAHRDRRSDVVFDDELQTQAENHGLVHLLEEQRDEFDAELSIHETDRAILEQRVAAIQQSLVGYESQLEALSAQRDLIADEAERKHGLLTQGLATRGEYTALMRTLAELVGEIGSLNASIERARLGIVEAQEELVRPEIDRLTQVTAELSDLSIEQARLEEHIIAEQHRIERLIVTAPVDGVVLHLPHAMEGNVIGAEAIVAELLPTGSDLVVETRLNPGDIDVVREGQEAQLRLVALNMRATPHITARIDYVSADRLRDDVTGQEYFAARMAIAGALPSDIDVSRIYPGMPTEVVIPVESRTLLEYLFKPITDSMQRAFRET